MVKVQLEIDQCMQTILATKTMEANLQLDQEELKTITLTTLELTSPWITATSKASTPWKNKTKITKKFTKELNESAATEFRLIRKPICMVYEFAQPIFRIFCLGVID